ncbi:TPA: fimbrial protein [Providencia alcalifaciens]
MSAFSFNAMADEAPGGARIRLTYRIDKPFVGASYIEKQLVAEFFTSMRYLPNTAGPVESKVYVQGTVTVPQSCTLNAGDVITIDFGSISSGTFRNAGEKPDRVTPVTRIFGVKCAGINAGTNLSDFIV